MMNWKQFKEYVEEQGVTDEMEIGYIKVSLHNFIGGNDIEISPSKDAFTVNDYEDMHKRGW